MKQQDNADDRGGRLSFLESVARAYTSRYDEMSEFCFLFPNKRSGTFFLKKLSENLGERAMLAPETLDIATFMARVSGREVVPRIDVIFRLYKVYCSLLGRVDSLRTEADLLDFDRFAPWAEVLVADFSEVDQYDADAAALFKNVRDFRSIATNFLNDEQLDIIERYFGYRPQAADVEGFWRSVGPEEDMSKVREKFVELWKLLPELYDGLLANLSADGLILPGTAFREALRRVEAEGAEALPWKKVVAVGFNMLSTTEAELFAQMRDAEGEDGGPYADFFWDATGPVLGAATGGSAARAMRRNIRNFPAPGWALPFLAMSDVQGVPGHITIAAAPSNSAQVKVAAEVVSGWIDTVDPTKIRDARTAVVIPDENLLMPLLHSLPDGLKAVNLTMGYSMRYTSVASFVFHLRRLQTRRRKSGGRAAFYHEDLRLFLAHPLVHVVTGSDKANELYGDIAASHMMTVPLDWIAERSSRLAAMLEPVARDAGVGQAIAYIDGVLAMVDRALGERHEGLRTVNSRIERSQVALYRVALARLEHTVAVHSIEMSLMSVFHLVDRLLAGEKVTFEGEPLEGLQVMGLLETRALDFDHLVVLSMNDKIMPRRGRKRTFIPDSLRRGYGLPTASRGEDLYSYYFYRLISRARDVTLIYDARAGEGMRSGGKSRYLMQLEMLYAPGEVERQNFTFALNSQATEVGCVEKTPAVMGKLAAFLSADKETGRNLSASALMNYCACQLLFYFKNVARISDDDEPGNYIDPITQGNIVHGAMLDLYFPADLQRRYLKAGERITYTSKDFDRMLSNREAIYRVVARAVNREHFHLGAEDLDRPLTGSVKIVADRLAAQVADVVAYDRDIAPVTLLGGEMTAVTRWKVGDAPEVNIRYAFDRVDIVGGRVRVVDYKTGSAHVAAKTFDDIFNGNVDAKYMIQLLVYGRLLEQRMAQEGDNCGQDGIGMEIYDVNIIGSQGAVTPKLESRNVLAHRDLDPEFEGRLSEMLAGLFDPAHPFRGAADESACTYCRLKSLCGRE